MSSDRSDPPLVSVVVATFDGRDFVEETLRSVFAQTYPRVEVVLCDDGSSDGTADLVEERFGERVRVIRQENRGVSVARNEGARHCHGAFIAFLDQDDLWEPELLERHVATLDARPDCALVYADSRVIDTAGRVRVRRSRYLRFWEGQVFEALLGGNFIPLETMLLRRAVFDEVGGFDARYRYLEDFDLCLRIAHRHTVALDPTPLARYRVHGDNVTHRKPELIAEWARLLDGLEAAVGELSSLARAEIVRQRALCEASLGLEALKQLDFAECDRHCANAREACPRGFLAKVRAARFALGVLPRAWARALLEALPARRLYGVRPGS